MLATCPTFLYLPLTNSSSPRCCVYHLRLGDTRRLRAPPQSRRGTRVSLIAPPNEMLEYDVTLTGVVAHMRIMTLDKRSDMSDDPLQMVVDFGKRIPGTIARLASLAGIAPSSSSRGDQGGGKSPS